MKIGAILAAVLGLIAVSLLIEIARKKGILMQSLAIAFIALVGALAVGSVVVFKFIELPALAH